MRGRVATPWVWAGVGLALTSGVLVALVSRSRAPVAPPAGLRYVTGRPAPLVPGTTYYARAALGLPLSLFVTADAVQNKLAGMGFSSIIATTDAAALPASWPLSERVGSLFVEATYSGPSTTMAVPSQVLAIWTM
jgi:hypothetical protein